MPFKNVTFPNLKLIHGLQKSVAEDTTFIKNARQNLEDRVKKSKWPQYSWAYQGRAISRADMEELLAFYNDVEGTHYSFKFSDPDYPELNSALLAHSTGTEWFLNIPYDTNTAGRHPIFHVNTGSLSVTVDGSPVVINSFSVNSDGLPVISVLGTVGTEVVRVSGPFWHAARFNMNLDWSLTALDQSNTPSYVTTNTIQLVERFEY